MLLFSREIQLSGSRLREALGSSVHLAEYAAQVTGVPVEVWATVYSPTANSIAFTAFLPDLTGLEAAFDKLMVDDEYNNLVEKMQGFAIPGSLNDRLVSIVHPVDFPADGRTLTYARVIRSSATVSRIGDAVELGAKVAARAEELTGAATLFGVDETGSFIGVTWVYGFADAAEAEQFDTQLASDPELGDLLRRTPDLFVTGASTRTMYRKVS